MNWKGGEDVGEIQKANEILIESMENLLEQLKNSGFGPERQCLIVETLAKAAQAIRPAD
jgi:hypothetical protein